MRSRLNCTSGAGSKKTSLRLEIHPIRTPGVGRDFFDLRVGAPQAVAAFLRRSNLRSGHKKGPPDAGRASSGLEVNPRDCPRAKERMQCNSARWDREVFV